MSSIRHFYTDLALLRGRIKALELRQQKLLRGPGTISSIDYSGMPKGGRVTNTINDCNELISINTEKQEIEEIFKLYDDVQACINTGRNDTKMSTILYEFYTEGKTIKEIATIIGCTPEYTSTLKTKAERNLNVILGQEEVKTDFSVIKL